MLTPSSDTRFSSKGAPRKLRSACAPKGPLVLISVKDPFLITEGIEALDKRSTSFKRMESSFRFESLISLFSENIRLEVTITGSSYISLSACEFK